MASSSRPKLTKLPSENEELDGFDDFTIASTWERVIAGIEAMCREWQAAGPSKLRTAGAEAVSGTANLYHVHKELSYGSKAYSVALFFRASREEDTRDEWREGLHRLQVWFGVRDFLLISPVSMSGVVLDAPDVTMLLSAAAVALSNCNSEWPVFVPVHDPTRKAYRGIEATKCSYSTRFEADRIGSRVPVSYMHLEGLYELFVSKVGFSSPDFAAGRTLRVGFTMKLTYRTPMKGFEYNTSESLPTAEPIANYEHVYEVPWDTGSPWAEWHSLDDPVKGFELIATFSNRHVTTSTEMAEFENMSTYEADKWLLRPILAKTTEELQNEEDVGFAGPLRAMVKAFHISKGAQYMENLATGDEPEMKEIMQSAKVPPKSALDRTIKDLFFQAPPPVTYRSNSRGHAYNIKGAPTNSLFTRFCLHALHFGKCNIRAIAVLWMAFVREVRYCWDEAEPLPGVAPDEPPDLSTCLLQQKFQLLALCIKRKRAERDRAGTSSFDGEIAEKIGDAEVGDESVDFAVSEKSSFSSVTCSPGDMVNEVQSYCSIYRNSSLQSDLNEPGNEMNGHYVGVGRKGSAGPVGTLMLLKTNRRLHAPVTQNVPSMTEDMVLEREHIIAALSHTSSEKDARVKLQSDILASDMSAFKAANPGAVLEDFVRWNSPRDWLQDESTTTSAQNNNMKGEWPPRGTLSPRMAEPGNTWVQIWDSVRAVPTSQQRPLFDHTREAEKVMHYLDTVRPQQLLAQMLSTVFVAAADILHQSFTKELQPLSAELEDLYSSMAAVLLPLEMVNSPEQSSQYLEQWLKDLLQLCADFESIEARIALGASFVKKLQSSQQLLAGLISKYLGPDTHYWTGATNSQLKNGIVSGALVKEEERDAVGDLFPPLSSTQLWKKSLRMGNYLNGHEPLFREVIFSCYEDYLDWHLERVRREKNMQRAKQILRQMHSHRMYICGTPNDLQVAFSVVAND